MLKILFATALLLLPSASIAATISGSGTQPYSCTVVGSSSISLLSTGQNQLTATGSGSIYQNGNTDYTLTAVTASGPDSNIDAIVDANGGTLSTRASTAGGATQRIAGELAENVTYTVSVFSSDGILTAGNYTASAELTCTAAP